MQPAIPYRIKEQQLWLSPDRCIFWEEQRSLIVSDLHFGKTGHFRKEGIAVPQSVYREDLQRLLMQVQYFQPRRLLIVGDLFHSRENKELELFRKWRDDFSDLDIRLIRGNHDILHEDWYQKAGIAVNEGQFREGPFAFIHDITEPVAVSAGIDDIQASTASGAASAASGAASTAWGAAEVATDIRYTFSGHIHPGIRIRGLGRQALQFPCFYFGDEYGVLPAFGKFTGTVSIDPPPEAVVFAILPSEGGATGRNGRSASIFRVQ